MTQVASKHRRRIFEFPSHKTKYSLNSSDGGKNYTSLTRLSNMVTTRLFNYKKERLMATRTVLTYRIISIEDSANLSSNAP